MPAYVNYKGDYQGIGRMLRSEFVTRHVKAKAEEIRAAAEGLAPVGSPADGDDTPGTFKDSFRVVEREQIARGGGRRIVYDVVSVDPNGLPKEVGHQRINPRTGRVTFVEGSHTLERAAQGLGALFDAER